MRSKYLTVLSAAAAVMFLAAPGAALATVVDDTSLTTAPIGGFDTNQHWTVDNEANGIQIGLAGLERFVGNYTPTGSTYIVQGGTFSSGPHAGQSPWDIAFSIDLGASGLSLNDVTANLCLNDAAHGVSITCFDVLDPSNIGDNATNGTTVAQNAETLSFPAIAALLGDSGYDPWIADTYDFTLTLNQAGVGPIATVSATLETVPEPSTLALLGGALLGFGFLAFRRRGKAAL